jgi:excisionase family DNA binding protein
LHHRDQSCRFPGWNVRFGQGHHVRHWAQGGPTTLENLVVLCHRHHRAVHEEGYQVERLPDGALQFRRPDGRTLPEVPLPAPLPADPVAEAEPRRRQWYPVSAAADFLGISSRTLLRWSAAGRIETWQTPGGHRRFHARDLARLREAARV